MDPNACLERLIAAMGIADHDEAKAAARDLAQWMDRGGFTPTPGAAQWSRLLGAIHDMAHRAWKNRETAD